MDNETSSVSVDKLAEEILPERLQKAVDKISFSFEMSEGRVIAQMGLNLPARRLLTILLGIITAVWGYGHLTI